MRIIDVAPLESETLLTQILVLSESRHLEFKRLSREMVSKSLKTICAFANSEGGTLVLGIADLKEFQGNDRLFGIEENLEALDDLQRQITSKFDPPIDNILMRRLSCSLHNGRAKRQHGHLMLITVPLSLIHI
jgi:ATP-dependent DNA helicase RecG